MGSGVHCAELFRTALAAVGDSCRAALPDLQVDEAEQSWCMGV